MDNKNYIQIQGWMINELNLKGNELLLYAIIYGNENNTQYGFYGSIKYMSTKLKLSIASTINILNKLELIGIIYKEEKIRDIDAYNQLNLVNSPKGCLFCGLNDLLLDNHHFPIRKRGGGTKTIKLCPNCHRRFHTLTDYNQKYKIKKYEN